MIKYQEKIVETDESIEAHKTEVMIKSPEGTALTELPLISDNYQVLLFDDEPILFSGTNKFGNIILGSSIDEDYEKKIERYFHVIIEPKTYLDFINKKISYYSILKNSKNIFIVATSFDKSDTGSTPISFNDIPKEYLPSEDTFCPDCEIQPTLSYTLSLRGNRADEHYALPDEVSHILKAFPKLIRSAFSGLKEISLTPNVLISPYASGSFNITFNVDFNNGQLDLYKNNDTYSVFLKDYLKDYLKYCIDYLPAEVNDIFSTDGNDAKYFDALLNKYQDIYRKSFLDVPPDSRATLLEEIKLSSNEMIELTEDIGSGFTSITLSNRVDDKEYPIALIDSTVKDIVNKTDSIIESKTTISEIDEKSVPYELHIFQLNTNTRTGKANLKIKDVDEMPKFNLHIDGEEILERTKYTESLHLNKWIKVTGKAHKVDGRIKRMELTFEKE
jgi:hypothetical protein